MAVGGRHLGVGAEETGLSGGDPTRRLYWDSALHIGSSLANRHYQTVCILPGSHIVGDLASDFTVMAIRVGSAASGLQSMFAAEDSSITF